MVGCCCSWVGRRGSVFCRDQFVMGLVLASLDIGMERLGLEWGGAGVRTGVAREMVLWFGSGV